LTLAAGTVFYHKVEAWSLLDLLYFSAVTLTTVGYGDLVPATAAGKVFTILYLFAGIGIILAFVDTIAKRSTERRANLFGKRRQGGAEPPRQTDENTRGEERDSLHAAITTRDPLIGSSSDIESLGIGIRGRFTSPTKPYEPAPSLCALYQTRRSTCSLS
jgi:voltage-gated potassium channel